MNKEHIFNIAISVDEDGIRSRAEEYCAREVANVLDDNWIKKGYYGRKELGARLEECVDSAVKKYMEEHHDELMEIVAGKVAEKIVKTKAYKDAMIEKVVTK